MVKADLLCMLGMPGAAAVELGDGEEAAEQMIESGMQRITNLCSIYDDNQEEAVDQAIAELEPLKAAFFHFLDAKVDALESAATALPLVDHYQVLGISPLASEEQVNLINLYLTLL